MLRKQDVNKWDDLMWHTVGAMMGSCEQGDESLASVIGGISWHADDCQLL